MLVDQLLTQIRSKVRILNPADLSDMLGQAVVVDIREKEEVSEGMIDGAIHVPRSVLELKIGDLVQDLSTPLVLYCAGGKRSLLSSQNLLDLGYTSLKSLEGGFERWKNEGRKTVKPAQVSNKLKKRYARQMLLTEISEAGQLKITNSKVSVIGAGGLGSPCLYYLAAAGVGHLRVIDFDNVELSNLHRQVLHSEDRISLNKAKSAQLTLSRLNSDVKVEPIAARIDVKNVGELIGDADLVIDGSDNFETRYAVNDYCAKNSIPLLFAGIYKFEGQLAFFKKGGPCLRCLYPAEAPPELAPSCQDAGVLGAFVGTIGCIQAMEAVKLLSSNSTALTPGELLLVDGMQLGLSKIKFSIDPHCPNHQALNN